MISWLELLWFFFASITRWFFYAVFFFLSFFKKSSPLKKALLIVRLDGIGDYILFRNFLKEINNSKKYKGYDLYLLGNIIWRDLAISLDALYVKEFIWLDLKKMTSDFFYASKKIMEIKKNNFAEVINPVYSRTLLMDLIIKNATSKVKIGFCGDDTNMLKWVSKLSSRFYTSLVFSKKEICFEFFKNRFFFEKILQKKIKLVKPKISNFHGKTSIKLPKKYAAIFIGANKKFRRWDLKNFQEIAFWLKTKNITSVFLGEKNELKGLGDFQEDFFINLIGQIPLSRIVGVLKNARLLLTNDTFAPHLGIALGVKKIIVISNGNSFGRFFPYPKEINSNCRVVLPPRLKINDFTTNYKKFKKRSFLNINAITSAMVKKAIKGMLEN